MALWPTYTVTPTMTLFNENHENKSIGTTVRSDAVEKLPMDDKEDSSLHFKHKQEEPLRCWTPPPEPQPDTSCSGWLSKVQTNRAQHICRFLITNIEQAPQTSQMLSIDLLMHRDGLFDLVNLVFECGLQLKMFDSQTYDDNLWYLTLHQQEYLYGWGDYSFGADEPVRLHIDEDDPGILSQLPTPIQVGNIGSFEGIMGSFEFVVQSITDVTNQNQPDANLPKTVSQFDPTYDCWDALIHTPTHFTGTIGCDFMTPEQKILALKLRQDYHDVMLGCDGTHGRPKRAPRRAWTPFETQLLEQMKQAGCSFDVVWDAILRWGFMDRTERGVSQRYSCGGRRLFLSSGAQTAAIQQAKRMCLELFQLFLNCPLPELRLNPYSYTEEYIFYSEIENVLMRAEKNVIPDSCSSVDILYATPDSVFSD